MRRCTLSGLLAGTRSAAANGARSASDGHDGEVVLPQWLIPKAATRDRCWSFCSRRIAAMCWDGPDVQFATDVLNAGSLWRQRSRRDWRCDRTIDPSACRKCWRAAKRSEFCDGSRRAGTVYGAPRMISTSTIRCDGCGRACEPVSRRADWNGTEPALPGPDLSEGKIFGRLSAWRNWIFIRENATGPLGALTCYGRPERPSFDWRRT